MISTRNPAPVRIGLIAQEPIRLEGMFCIFNQPALEGHPQLQPVTGSIDELLSSAELDYLVVDINSSVEGLETLDNIRRTRPSARQIVIGPVDDEELILESIVAGARAYLDLTATPEIVRTAIHVVMSGSIWAPRKMLSKLIDRLVAIPTSSNATPASQLTTRERQVMNLILMARSNREIADQLGIEEGTVKAHVTRLMRKTGSESRIALSLRALSGPERL
jgi:DNA-binding NarL/FixJ family response regulator